MERAEFEAALSRDGYRIMARDMPPNTVNPDHTHEFDARVLVTAGVFTMTIAGVRRVLNPGDWCDVPAGLVHAEACGPDGVSLVAGRRVPAA